MRFVLKVAFVE